MTYRLQYPHIIKLILQIILCKNVLVDDIPEREGQGGREGERERERETRDSVRQPKGDVAHVCVYSIQRHLCILLCGQMYISVEVIGPVLGCCRWIEPYRCFLKSYLEA